MTSRNYRTWLILAVAGNVVLAAALAFLWWRSRTSPEHDQRAAIPTCNGGR